jgi:hypothetical protein
MNKEQQDIILDVYREHCLEQSKYLTHGGTIQEFIKKIKTDDKFSEKWGLKIEERELSLEERCELGYKYVDSFEWDMLMGGGREGDEGNCNDYKIPTKLITITYNDKTIENYEFWNKRMHV